MNDDTEEVQVLSIDGTKFAELLANQTIQSAMPVLVAMPEVVPEVATVLMAKYLAAVSDDMVEEALWIMRSRAINRRNEERPRFLKMKERIKDERARQHGSNPDLH
jgi:hypothetical protein